MLSYHNDENLKNLVVSEMKNHQKKDQFIKGSYNEIKDGKFNGCAVGCTIDSLNLVCNKSYYTDEHSVFEEALGIPEWLARLQDSFFENLPENENSQFAVDFLDSIPVGVNLEPVKWKFCSFILKEGIERILNQKNIPEEIRGKVIKSMQGVLSVHQSAINTGKWNSGKARSSERSVVESARSSAESAAESARSVAESAAWSARSSADSAAWSARSSAESAAWSARSSALSASWSARSSALSAAESARSSALSAAESAESVALSAAESARSSALSAAESAESVALSAAESAESVALSARSSALSASWSARSSAWSAESSERSVADSAAWSAESSERSVADSAALSARSSAFKRYSEELIRLLKEIG